MFALRHKCRCLPTEYLIKMDKSFGYRQIIQICIPLMMSMAAVTVMEFTDRVFLSRYSLEAISAAIPAGGAAMFFIFLFSGVSGYASVFIAQYIGAKAEHHIGKILWQAIYFSLASGLAFIVLAIFAKTFFAFAGHAPEIQRLEVIYFRILCYGAIFRVTADALTAFYIGRAATRPIMIVNMMGIVLNVPLDYALINGFWIFPQWGIAGAGIATVASWAFTCVLFAALIFNKNNNRKFRLLSAKSLDKELFMRLITYGLPSGLQFCLDIASFIFFVFLVGRIGKSELAASNIVLSISSLAFMPMLGISQALSTLTGQALGRKNPSQAKSAVLKSIHLLLIYIIFIDLLYIFAPHWIIEIFMPGDQTAADHETIAATASVLLQFVAVYVFFDALYMAFAGALRGAGDTRFILWSTGLASVFIMMVPSFIAIEILQLGLVKAWGCIMAYVLSLFLICGFRYLKGHWQGMRIVEKEMLECK
ncbi:MAG: MATE family efflux transporter [Desulfobacteraceae bacterium]|nr:MATE family efflux transporter [Desulfobacteraceae bacterium]